MADKPEDLEELINKMAMATAVNATTEEKPPSSNVEMASKIADTLFDLKAKIKKKMLGILDKNQIQGIKRLELVNDLVFDGKNKNLSNIVDNEIFFSVALSGKGREQLVNLTKIEDHTEENISRFKRYLG